MTMITSKYHADNILNWEVGTQMPTPPANLYVGLLTAMPTDNAGTSLVEVTGNNYARAQITPAQWAAITTLGDNLTEQSLTAAGITFATPSGSGWGTCVGVTLNDALTTGHWLRAMTLTGGSQAIAANATVNIPAGDIARQVV